MKHFLPNQISFWAAATLLIAGGTARAESGFTDLFDGKTLDGWAQMSKKGDTSSGQFFVENGILVCPANTGDNFLYTNKEFSDFILRLDFKLFEGGNNGVGIRCPLGKPGDQLAYGGMEIQILDDSASKHATIKPWQHNGSVYGLIPSKKSQPRLGEWNSYEITARGRHIKVVLNGTRIVDGNLNSVTDADIIQHHPGMFRDGGFVGILTHQNRTEFRNIRIKELPRAEKENTAPEGFTALFNGKNLDGWKSLVENPPKRAAMSKTELAGKQKKADELMRQNWKIEEGTLVYRGNAFDSLCTKKNYGDFEMLVDWKIQPKGDSGIYLRGSPQVQIWEPNSPGQFKPPDGSGAFYNNLKNPRHPMRNADKPVGQWNRFRIVMVGEKVHIFLNGQKVVENTTMENYWERDKPIYSSEQIELQAHKEPVWFKNIYIREIKTKKQPR